jgi:hypothetical protein
MSGGLILVFGLIVITVPVLFLYYACKVVYHPDRGWEDFKFYCILM